MRLAIRKRSETHVRNIWAAFQTVIASWSSTRGGNLGDELARNEFVPADSKRLESDGHVYKVNGRWKRLLGRHRQRRSLLSGAAQNFGCHRAHPEQQIAVLTPEPVERRWYLNLLHNHRSAVLKALLLFQDNKRITVINIPWYLSD